MANTVLPPLNEVPAATECLYSTVRNVTFNRMFFGFLPPHGKLLACGEELTVWGNIQDWMHKLTPQERHRRSFERALAGSNQVDFQSGVGSSAGVLFKSSLTKNQSNSGFVTWDSAGTGGRVIPRSLVLVKTPAVHLYDGVNKVTQMLQLSSYILYTADPCWTFGDETAITSAAIGGVGKASCDTDSQNYLKDPRFVNSGYWHDMMTGHGRLTSYERLSTDVAHTAAGANSTERFPNI